MKVLVVAEHNNTELLPATLHAVNAANQIGSSDLVVIGTLGQNGKTGTLVRGNTAERVIADLKVDVMVYNAS